MKNDVEIPVQKIELQNGIRLLVKEDHSTPIISVVAYFIGGRGSETPLNSGISALSQRLVTKGADNLDARALAEELEYHGIYLIPFYGLDMAGLKMKTLSRHFDRALDIFAKMIVEPVFSEEEFEKEKKNLIDDINKEKDNTLSYNLQMCDELVFEGHPYGLHGNGTFESVSNLTREQIIDHHMNVYCPGHMVIAIVGDIEANEAEAKITQSFAGFNRYCTIATPDNIRGPIKNVKEKNETSDKQQVAISIGFHAPPLTDEDYYTFQVLNQVLSGMGSRLFIELRDKMGLAYSVNSIYCGYVHGGIFEAYILTAFHHKEKARVALLEEVDRLRTRLVTYDELVRAKHYHLGLFDISLQSKLSIATKLAYYELAGIGYDFIDQYYERIKRITRQKIKRAAEKYLKPQSYAIALLTPSTFPKNLQ